MPKGSSNPPFKASMSTTVTRSRRRSTSSTTTDHAGAHTQAASSKLPGTPTVPLSPLLSDTPRAEPSSVPGAAVDSEQDDDDLLGTTAESTTDALLTAFSGGTRRLRRTRSMSTSNVTALTVAPDAPSKPRTRTRLSTRKGAQVASAASGPTDATHGGPSALPPHTGRRGDVKGTNNSITGRFHFNEFASFGRDMDVHSSLINHDAKDGSLEDLYHPARLQNSGDNDDDDDDDGDDALFPHSDSDGDVHSHSQSASTPPPRRRARPYRQSQFHSSRLSHDETSLRTDSHPLSPNPSSTGYDLDEPSTPSSPTAKPTKRHPPLKVNLNDPNKSNLLLALEVSEDVDQDQLALLGPPSYEEMISDAIIALDKADALRHNTPYEQHDPLGQKPADIFGYILTKFQGQLSTAFRGSATQALKKGLRRGRFYRVAPGTKPGYAGNGGYAVKKDYQGRTARGRAKKNHGSGVLGSPTSAKYAALQAARIAAINGDPAAAAVLEQARQQQMKTRKGGKKGGVDFDEWEALLAPPIPGVGYVMPPGMEMEVTQGSAAAGASWTAGGLRKRPKTRKRSRGDRSDDDEHDDVDVQHGDSQAEGEDDEGGTDYDPRRTGGPSYAAIGHARGSKRGPLANATGDPSQASASATTRSRPLRAARSHASRYADASEEEVERPVQYMRQQRGYRYNPLDDNDAHIGSDQDDAMDVDRPPSPMFAHTGQQQPPAPTGAKPYRRPPSVVTYASFYDPTRDASPVAYSPLLLQPRRRAGAAFATPLAGQDNPLPSPHPHAIQPQMPTLNQPSTSPLLHRRTQAPHALYLPTHNHHSHSHGGSPSDDNTFGPPSRPDSSHRQDSVSATSPAGVYIPNRRIPPPPPSYRVRPRMGQSLVTAPLDLSTGAHPSPPPVVTYPSAPSPIRRAERERLGVDASFYRVDAGASSRDRHAHLDEGQHPSSRTGWAATEGRGPSASPPGPLLVLGRSPEGSVVTAPLASPPPVPLSGMLDNRRTVRDHMAEQYVDQVADEYCFGDEHPRERIGSAHTELGHAFLQLRAPLHHIHPAHPHSTSSPLGIRNLADSATSPNMHGANATRISRSAARAAVLVNLMPLPATASSSHPSSLSSAPPSPTLDSHTSLHGDQQLDDDDEHSLVASAEAAGCSHEDAQVAMSLLALFGNASVTGPSAEVTADPFAAAAATHPSPPPTAPGTTIVTPSQYAQQSIDPEFHPHVLSSFPLNSHPYTTHAPPVSYSQTMFTGSSSSTRTAPAAAYASTSSAARALVAVMSRSQVSSPQVSPTVLAHHNRVDRASSDEIVPDPSATTRSPHDQTTLPAPLPPVLPLLGRVPGAGEGAGALPSHVNGPRMPARVLPPKASMANLSSSSVNGVITGSAATAPRDKRERGEVAVRAE